jgi:hypothetical protein
VKIQMEDKNINATSERPIGERTMDAALVEIDLLSYMKLIKE